MTNFLWISKGKYQDSIAYLTVFSETWQWRWDTQFEILRHEGNKTSHKFCIFSNDCRLNLELFTNILVRSFPSLVTSKSRLKYSSSPPNFSFAFKNFQLLLKILFSNFQVNLFKPHFLRPFFTPLRVSDRIHLHFILKTMSKSVEMERNRWMFQLLSLPLSLSHKVKYPTQGKDSLTISYSTKFWSIS